LLYYMAIEMTCKKDSQRVKFSAVNLITALIVPMTVGRYMYFQAGMEVFLNNIFTLRLVMNFWQSKHSSQIKLSTRELQQISQKIDQDYAPVITTHGSELVLLPVDPYHLYAYWNLSGNLANNQKNKGIESDLSLRVYWRPDKVNVTSKSKLWFDVDLKNQHQQKVRLPIDATDYSAAIGRNIPNHGFVVYAHSNIIHVPRGRMAAQQISPVKTAAAENIDLVNREELVVSQALNLLQAESITGDSITQLYDETLINSKIENALREKGIEKNIHMLLNPTQQTANELHNSRTIATRQSTTEHNTSSQGHVK
jgi:hypothetical protein